MTSEPAQAAVAAFDASMPPDGSPLTYVQAIGALRAALEAYEAARPRPKLPALPKPVAVGWKGENFAQIAEGYTIPQVVRIQQEAFDAGRGASG